MVAIYKYGLVVLSTFKPTFRPHEMIASNAKHGLFIEGDAASYLLKNAMDYYVHLFLLSSFNLLL